MPTYLSQNHNYTIVQESLRVMPRGPEESNPTMSTPNSQRVVVLGSSFAGLTERYFMASRKRGMVYV